MPHDWWLLDIVCDVAGRSQADLGKARVRIIAYPGDNITCTFVNGASAAILGRVYFDRNADGKLSRHEDGIKGWQVTVYTAAGQKVKIRPDQRPRQVQHLGTAAGDLQDLR